MILGQSVPQLSGLLKPAHRSWKIILLQIEFAKGIHGTAVPMFRRLSQPDH